MKSDIHYSQIKKHIKEKKIADEIVPFIKKENTEGRFPSRREIESRFNTNLTNGVRTIYRLAEVPYLPHKNQALKYEKAKSLTKIVEEILPKIGIIVCTVRDTYQHGVDIVGIDKDGNKIGVELKAYCRHEMVKKRNISQINRFIRDEQLKMCYLFTTTDRIEINLQIKNTIKIYNYSSLMKFCNSDQVATIEQIRNKSTNEKSEGKIKKCNEIIKHAKKLHASNSLSIQKLNSEMKIDFRSYFTDIRELYKLANLPLPSRLWGGARGEKAINEDMKKKIIEYVNSEVSAGHYPSGVDVGKNFGVTHIWNFIKMNEIYKALSLPSYRHRRQRSALKEQETLT